MKRGALFPIDMGNYSRNSFRISDVFKKLQQVPSPIQFIGYHWRRSGNFVFLGDGTDCYEVAETIGLQVMKLRCLARGYSVLEVIMGAMPHDAHTTPGGSIVLNSMHGPRKLIWVGISRPVRESAMPTGQLSSRVSVLTWPTDQDVICMYDRPPKQGDVGQVTTAILKSLNRLQGNAEMIATGRALSVIQDILTDKGIVWA